MSEEPMDIVDDNDQVIGQTTQGEIYSQKLTHRIVHIFVINPETNEVYFQVRSENKSYLPGFYCTSAGGHVSAGETYEQAAKRELVEEIIRLYVEAEEKQILLELERQIKYHYGLTKP